MALRNGFRWHDKPPRGSQFDRSHPAAQALRTFLLLAEGSGGAYANLADAAYPGAAVNSPAWGPGGVVVASGSGISQVGSDIMTAGDFTLRMVLRPRVLSSEFAIIDDASRNFSVFVDSAGAIDWLALGTQGNPGIALGLAAGVASDVVFTRRASDGLFSAYRDGILRGTATRTGAAVAPFASSLGPSPSGSTAFDGTYYLYQRWGRLLSAGEVAGLYPDPYGTILPPATRRFFAPSSGGPVAGSASLAAVSALSATGSLAIPGASALSAVATLAATPKLAIPGAASLAAVSTLAAAGSAKVAGAAALAAVSTLTASAGTAIPGSASLSALATLAATGGVSTGAGASLVAVATLTASGSVALHGVAALGSVATLAAAGSYDPGGGAVAGSAHLAATSTLLAAGSVAIPGSAALAAVATLRATASGGTPARRPDPSYARVTIAGAGFDPGLARAVRVNPADPDRARAQRA